MYKLENRIGLRQFNVIKEHFFKVINRHFFRGIRGHRPANLDCRIASGNDSGERKNTSGNDSKVECVTSGNDGHWGQLFSGCELFNYPSPADKSATSPARGEVTRLLRCARNDICCSGRSMIEMLGVLAIIGVLSVGGIAGYSKAMEKWKINKTIEQVEEITQNILTLYANQKTFDFSMGDDLNLDDLKTLGIIPANLKQGRNDSMFINPLGGSSYIFGDPDFFEIRVTGISKEACVALSTHNWNFSSPYFFGIVAENMDGPVESYYCIDEIDSLDGRWSGDGGFMACKCARTSTPMFGLPVPPEVAAEACSCNSNVCEFNITYSLTGVDDPENCGKDIDWD